MDANLRIVSVLPPEQADDSDTMNRMQLGNYTGNDIELCRTTNFHVEKEAVDVLIERQIPFSRKSMRIPFFHRRKYRGASKVYVISIHPQQYSQARRALDSLGSFYHTRLILSNY